MQKFEDTVITDNGLNLLATINDGDDKIKYTKAVLASDDLTQADATAIQKITTLSVKMSSPISINSRINDTINLSASFTNETITEDFDFYCIGWYAKGIKDPTEYLIAISPSTVKQTMPAGSNNAATASISPKYAMALSQNAEVEITTNPAGSVTKDQLDKAINDLFGKSIINDGTSMTGSQDLNSIYGTYLGNINGDDKPQNVPSGFGTGQFISYGDGESTHPITQLIYDDVNNVSYFRSYDPAKNKWTDWDLIITKSQLNAVLPTDIARTGEDNDFKGKNTFETDPVNKNGDSYGLAKDIATKVTDNGDNSIEINKQAVTPVRDNKNGSINFNSKDMTPADDSKVVHSKDMRKPASDVAGIEEVNAKQDKIGYTPADDSKVAHLSGANNFDTVPTVNNNPLLLASSLPSDLARTGQTNTFTAPQTFSIAPTIKDASKDKGDNQAATMADLKSVKESAWYMIPENNSNTIRDIGWMKRDSVNNYLYILYNFATVPWVPTASEMLVDLSSYVDALDDARGYIMLSSNSYSSNSSVWNLNDPHRAMSTVWAKDATLIAGSGFNTSDLDDGTDYLKLTTFNDNVDNNPWTNKCLRVHYSNWIRS